MDRVDAEVIYDSGGVACVEFILDFVGRFAQHEDRLCGAAEVSPRDQTSTNFRRTSGPQRRVTRAEPASFRSKRRAAARSDLNHHVADGD